MRKKRQRLHAAWLLLMLYVPLLIATSLHMHTEVADDPVCEECLHHVCHESHFSQVGFSVDDCLFCQLSSLPIMLPTVLVFTPLMNFALKQKGHPVAFVSARSYSSIPPRAPPYSFC